MNKNPNFSDYANDCVAFLQKLISTPSVNGKDSEIAVVELIAAEAEKLGLPYKIIAKDSNRPNIFVGENFEGEDDLLLVAHLDTVPTGDLGSWKFSPFTATIDDNKLYGRGAVDCKGGIATSLYTLKALSDMGKPHTAKFVGVADEESGADSELGLKYLLNQGLRAKEAIYTYGDGAGYDSLTIGHRGVMRIWVTCHGESVHSGFREWQDRVKGESAIEGINEFLSAIRDFTVPGTSQYFPGCKFVLTPTLIEGGQGESIVPEQAKVLLDIRTLPEQNNEEIIAAIKAITNDLSTKKRTYTLTIKNNVPGALTDPSSSIVQRALRLNKEMFGVDSEPMGSGPANEGYMLISRGIPTIMGYGPLGDGAHSVDEYAELSSLPHCIEILTNLALAEK